MTQHEKIIELCKDGHWHCGNEFRALFIFSPHKRRSEIESEGEWRFEDRQCVHGNKLVRDYMMVKTVKVAMPTKPPTVLPQFQREVIGATSQKALFNWK